MAKTMSISLAVLPSAGMVIGAGSGVEFTLQVAKVWQVGTQADAVGLARIMLSRL